MAPRLGPRLSPRVCARLRARVSISLTFTDSYCGVLNADVHSELQANIVEFNTLAPAGQACVPTSWTSHTIMYVFHSVH